VLAGSRRSSIAGNLRAGLRPGLRASLAGVVIATPAAAAAPFAVAWPAFAERAAGPPHFDQLGLSRRGNCVRFHDRCRRHFGSLVW
jgi:hypothetical protein